MAAAPKTGTGTVMEPAGGRRRPNSSAQQTDSQQWDPTQVVTGGVVAEIAAGPVAEILQVHGRPDLAAAHSPQRLVDGLLLEVSGAGQHLADDLTTQDRLGARPRPDPGNSCKHLVAERAAALGIKPHVVRRQREYRSLGQCHVVRFV
jgi:hypothetical protein